MYIYIYVHHMKHTVFRPLIFGDFQLGLSLESGSQIRRLSGEEPMGPLLGLGVEVMSWWRCGWLSGSLPV